MATSVAVTAEQAIARMRALIAAGDDEGAVRFGREVLPGLWGSLTADQSYVISSLMSGAERAFSYAQFDVDDQPIEIDTASYKQP